ncbi:MAG: 3-hydroxyacyl-CoA dehydrogenase/enoyl-CoA hydratase family protein [Synechococcales bacterium]|nr:3-hydroxyacyl-CoA dehydrogenase/enoyl-CoA hydratase family protein [Synechococcales bacterium]
MLQTIHSSIFQGKPFRTVAVLGAGVMGTQIAAHLANAGLTVHLLDLAAPAGDPNQVVETAFKKALKQSPPIFFTEKTARRVTLGNFDQHFDRLAQVDWVIEAVVEKLEIKQQLMERLEAVVSSNTIISSNTSGLPIHEIVKQRSPSFQKRFLGTHFFNPPRYLKLLELIPTPETDPTVLQQMQWLGETQLGKGVVIAKDTPNFIANRIGMYVTMLGLNAWLQQDYSIEEIDRLTGHLVGRPKSATFRTADLVGLDTLLYVTDNLYPAIPEDDQREVFQAPALLRKLVATGTLGAKTRQGFYKKQQGEILSLDRETLTYQAAAPMQLGDLDRIAKLPNLRDRLQHLYQDSGRAGLFFRQTLLATLNYAANRIPEIADSPLEIDQALRWGFGWELGPFEMWEAIGFDQLLQAMQADNLPIPSWIQSMQAAGMQHFYDRIVQPITPNVIYPDSPQDEKHLLWQNSEAALLDMGDGVGLYEFRSKGNTLSFQVVRGLAEVMTLLETTDLKGLVIGNRSDHFSGGANLAEMAEMALTGNLQGIANLIVEFQTLLQRIHYSAKPIVAAIQGRVLGGGCELVMACPRVVAAAETYIGLVEVSVGLIPGAGGLMRMVARAAERSASEDSSQLQPWIKAAFETIATARVSTSATEAIALGFLPDHTHVLLNSDRRLAVAKAEVLHLADLGYLPPSDRQHIPVLGRPGRALLEYAAYLYEQGGYASAYDRELANHIAYVMTGGEITAPALVSEDYLLQLERQRFVPLLSQPKTQERIAHLLNTKKPLRN